LSKKQTHQYNKYGKIPLKEYKHIAMWDVLTVDLCGLWKMQTYFWDYQTWEEIDIWALTMADELSCWLEIDQILDKSAKNIAKLVDTQ